MRPRKPKPIVRVMLTTRQVEQIRPFYDRVKAASVMGSPGMLVGQIGWNDQDGAFYITPVFLSHEKAKFLQAVGSQAGIPKEEESHG